MPAITPILMDRGYLRLLAGLGIAARMRQVALAGTRPNQQQADLRPESGPRSKGLSAVAAFWFGYYMAVS